MRDASAVSPSRSKWDVCFGRDNVTAIRYRYQTIEYGETDIHIRTLRDRLQFSDPDGQAAKLGISSANWPHFGVIWDSGRVLARLMVDFDVDSRRVLEVGCGIGLASLVLNRRGADITATDYHPCVERFLLENIRINRGQPIPFVHTSWQQDNGELGKFDLIIGSDLLYERPHAKLLSSFVDNHAQTCCEVIVVDPRRGHVARFNKRMVKLGYTHDQYDPPAQDDVLQPFSGHVLTYRR
jgi:predicted nicotinamide N-methyase